MRRLAMIAALSLAGAAHAQAPPAANRANAAVTGAPSVLVGSAGQPDSCAGVQSLGYGSPMIGATIVFQRTDKGCSRIRKAKMLQQLGLDAAAVQIMCADPDVKAAMDIAGTPCESLKERP